MYPFGPWPFPGKAKLLHGAHVEGLGDCDGGRPVSMGCSIRPWGPLVRYWRLVQEGDITHLPDGDEGK